MPRINRIDIGDTVYHVINRSNARIQIFNSDEDYDLFERVLEEANERFSMRILSYCVMPNHWHLVLYPRQDGDLQKSMAWLSMTHTQRWHSSHKTTGSGHLYQGRYKSFLVKTSEYLIQLFRYVERNPLRAKLVKNAEDWKWSSLRRRERGNNRQKELLSEWPVEIPVDYLNLVNTPQTNEEVESLRRCINKGRPYGDKDWADKMTCIFKLESTLREPGRPKKSS